MKWFNDINITSAKRLVLMLLAVVFMLSACSNKETKPVDDAQGNPSSISEEHKSAGCWQAGILNVLYDSIGMTVMKMFDKMTKGALNLMFVGFAVWLAFRLLKFVSSFAEDNPAEVWNEIIKKAGICLFCGLLASTPAMTLSVVNNLLFPIYNAFLEFGSEIMSSAVSGYNVDTYKVLGETVSVKEYDLKCSADGFTDIKGEFPESTKNMMKCMICALSQRLTFGMTVSLEAMGIGFTGFVVGFIMLSSFVVVYLSFAFYMVDSIFKFGVMILMLPLLILSFAFGPTKEWTKKGFANIMESAVLMMTLCILLTMTIVAMVILINENQTLFNSNANFSDVSLPMVCLLMMSFLVSGSISVSAAVSGALIGSKVSTKTQEKLKAVISMIGHALAALITSGVSAKIKSVMNSIKAIRKLNEVKDKLHKLAGRH